MSSTLTCTKGSLFPENFSNDGYVYNYAEKLIREAMLEHHLKKGEEPENIKMELIEIDTECGTRRFDLSPITDLVYMLGKQTPLGWMDDPTHISFFGSGKLFFG